MVIMFPQQEHNPMPGRHFRSFTAVSADKDQISTATSGLNCSLVIRFGGDTARTADAFLFWCLAVF
jgi:hypothetical protein